MPNLEYTPGHGQWPHLVAMLCVRDGYSKEDTPVFTVALKLKAVETAERTSKSETAKLFNVDPKAY